MRNKEKQNVLDLRNAAHVACFGIDSVPGMTSQRDYAQAPVPGKPISANRGLNLANPGLKFILRLDSVPESTINTNLGINEGLNLIHLARSINSLIGGKT